MRAVRACKSDEMKGKDREGTPKKGNRWAIPKTSSPTILSQIKNNCHVQVAQL